jgi:hypothetical protein
MTPDEARVAREARDGLVDLLGLAPDASWSRIVQSVRSLQQSTRGLPDDLRDRGWSVAVHNDYHQAIRPGGPKERATFWLLTHAATGRFLKGEGPTDQDALNQIRAQLREVVG